MKISGALMRGFAQLSRLPEPVFDGLRAVYSRVRHRQALPCVARPR